MTAATATATTATTRAAAGTAPTAYLRDARFDHGFVIGIALLALASGVVATLAPELLPWMLLIDVWVLGYHHVIATFTRLCCDAESFRRHRTLVLVLPPVIGVACTAAGVLAGPWLLSTTYFYWQWFHYTRQSYGIARVYERKRDAARAPDRLAHGALYAVAVWGLLHRTSARPTSFLGFELRVLAVPELLATASALLALGLFAAWLLREARRALTTGRLPIDTAYGVSHHAVFVTAYVLMPDLDTGWLVVSAWHNAQYIAFVWLSNARRFEGGIDARSRVLSTLSQPRHVLAYLGLCLAVSTALYLALNRTLAALSPLAGLELKSLALIAYSTLNFHHYVVDALIWRAPRAATT